MSLTQIWSGALGSKSLIRFGATLSPAIVVRDVRWFIRTPGRYILKGDLTASEPNFPCIVVEADHVDLNLNRLQIAAASRRFRIQETL